jgi:hypothetical protein
MTAVKDSPLPVLEDHVAREARRLSVAREKEEKDIVKSWRDLKAREREALLRRHRQQRLEGLPKEESPSESVLEGEGDDSGDDDAGSRHGTVTFLAHLPDVWPLLGPVGGGSTSWESRAASAPIKGKEDRPEERAHEGPSVRRSAEPKVLPAASVMPRKRAQSPRSSSAGCTTASTPEPGAVSSGVRTQGQAALVTQRSSETLPAQARGSSGPAGGSTEGPSQRASGGSGKPGTKPLIPMSG